DRDGALAEGLEDCGTGFGVRDARLGFVFCLLSLQDGAAAVDGAFGAAKSESDFGGGGGADQFIFGGGPFPKAQSGLGDAECATLLPDCTEGAAGEFGHFLVGLGAQEGEFAFGPRSGVALHGAAVVCGAW